MNIFTSYSAGRIRIKQNTTFAKYNSLQDGRICRYTLRRQLQSWIKRDCKEAHSASFKLLQLEDGTWRYFFLPEVFSWSSHWSKLIRRKSSAKLVTFMCFHCGMRGRLTPRALDLPNKLVLNVNEGILSSLSLSVIRVSAGLQCRHYCWSSNWSVTERPYSR